MTVELANESPDVLVIHCVSSNLTDAVRDRLYCLGDRQAQHSDLG